MIQDGFLQLYFVYLSNLIDSSILSRIKKICSFVNDLSYQVSYDCLIGVYEPFAFVFEMTIWNQVQYTHSCWCQLGMVKAWPI